MIQAAPWPKIPPLSSRPDEGQHGRNLSNCLRKGHTPFPQHSMSVEWLWRLEGFPSNGPPLRRRILLREQVWWVRTIYHNELNLTLSWLMSKYFNSKSYLVLLRTRTHLLESGRNTVHPCPHYSAWFWDNYQSTQLFWIGLGEEGKSVRVEYSVNTNIQICSHWLVESIFLVLLMRGILEA